MPSPRLFALALGTLALAACSAGRAIPQRVDVPAAPVRHDRQAAEPAPSIEAAHFAISDAPATRGRDGIPVVFSVDVDAASLRPEVFWVSLEDGDRVRADEAILSPANEADENRTVLVIGDFGAPDANPPVSIAVYGNLFAEDGRSLDGLAADVEPFDASGRVVAAERVTPARGRCEGSSAAVRSYWIDGLRDVTAEDLAAVRVRLADGSTVTPHAFDDHVAGDQDTEDNVLDLCLSEGQRPVHLSIAAGTFRDAAGHPSAGVEVEIRDAAPG